MRPDAVVKERQRMQQNPPPLAGKQVGKLRNNGLRLSAQLSAEHYNDVALGFVKGLTQRCDLACIDA